MTSLKETNTVSTRDSLSQKIGEKLWRLNAMEEKKKVMIFVLCIPLHNL